MTFFDATIVGYSAWRVCSGTALLMLYVLLRIHWSRQDARRSLVMDTSVDKNAALPPNRAVKTPLSSTDTQRIDHLYRHVSLKAGEHADLKDLTFGRLPQFRVAFAGVEQASGQDFAHIKLELGGVAADCGSAVQELGENDFLVPRGAPGNEHCSIHYTCGKSDAVSFLQVKVAKFDAVAQSASIDVMHVRGRRAA